MDSLPITQHGLSDETNHCGTCTMCCKLLGVEELRKPPATWCPHCKVGNGCGIYDTRPPSCRTYTCVWLQWRETGQVVPDALRPDRCRVVIDASKNGTDHFVRCDPVRPDAWKGAAVQTLLKGMGQTPGLKLFLVIGDTKKRIAVI